MQFIESGGKKPTKATKATRPDEDVVEAITEVLREPGARLAGDSWFFAQRVAPLYARYGEVAVDAALRCIHDDARRRVASEIRALKLNAAALKREIERP